MSVSSLSPNEAEAVHRRIAEESGINRVSFKLHLRRRAWIILDILLAAGAILAAYALQPEFVFGWGTSNHAQPGAYEAALIYPWFVLLCMHVAGLHDPLGDRRLWFGLLKVVVSVVAALGLCLLVLYFVSLQQIGRSILIRTFLVSTCALGGARVILWRLASEAPKRVGCVLRPEALTRFKGIIGSNRLPVELFPTELNERKEEPAAIADLFVRRMVDEVVVAIRDDERAIWMACLGRGIQVSDVSVFLEREYYKVSCDDIDLSWFLAVDLQWNHPFYHRLKRVMDFCVASVGLVLSAPILLLAGVAIALESGFPIFYSQTRVGLRGRQYRIWKLRTMRQDAETNGAQWAQRSDPRVTVVGRILRLTRVDELPQFWNVLKGEMSMIGPRPERPEFVDQLGTVIPMYSQRHWIKPGITGWAQINHPYGASVDDAREKLCYDLYYMKHASPLLDFHIALRTIGAAMKGSR